MTPSLYRSIIIYSVTVTSYLVTWSKKKMPPMLMAYAVYSAFFLLLGKCEISSVLSCHSKDLKRQTSVTAQLQLRVLFSKQRRVYPGGVKVGQPQRRGLNKFWLPLFIYFVSFPLSLAFANWASQVGGMFASSEVLTPICRFSFDLFSWAFPFVFSHHHFGLLSPTLTT